MARLLLTGVSGYLGAVVAERAVAAGWEVAGTYFRHRPAPDPRLRTMRLDLRDLDAVATLADADAPDAILHTAYRQDGPDARAIIVDGSRTLAAVAARRGARFVHLSTDLVFSGRAGRPLTEDDPPDPTIVYGEAKLAAERAVADVHPGALAVRTSLIYGGPDGPVSRYERAAVAAARGETDTVFFRNELRCPVQVADLAGALLELLARDEAGVLHVAGPEAIDRHAFAALLAAAGGADPTALRGGEGPADRPSDCRLDTTRARALLARPPRGVSAVLA